MRRKIVAGNWKMNLTFNEANSLHCKIEEELKEIEAKCAVYHFVPSIYLHELLKERDTVIVGAQNGYPIPNGAFTGEVSMAQLSSIETKAVLIGHSERRQIFGESDDFLKEKVDAAIQVGIEIFFCCGESLEQRESGNQEKIILTQLENSLFHLSATEFQNVVIAYEPIWAIGTGKTASANQANDMHIAIRRAIAEKYDETIASSTAILYGGSCKPDNAEELFAQSDIDGGLIGGASLKAEDFITIISSFN